MAVDEREPWPVVWMSDRGRREVDGFDQSVDQFADLDQVVGEDAVAAPCPGTGEAVDPCSVEPEVAFGAADPSFTAGAPSHHLAERTAVLDLATCRGRSALGGQHDVANPGVA